MVRRKPADNLEPLPPPATTLEGRENQLIAMAYDLAEERMHNKSASAQEVVHFLKLGTTRERLEQDKLRNELGVLQARVKEMEGRRTGEDMYNKALAAFRGYSGQEPIEDDDSDAEELY